MSSGVASAHCTVGTFSAFNYSVLISVACFHLESEFVSLLKLNRKFTQKTRLEYVSFSHL